MQLWFLLTKIHVFPGCWYNKEGFIFAFDNIITINQLFMSQPLLSAVAGMDEKEVERGIPFPKTRFLKARISQTVRFFRQLHPYNWFNDLSNIEISLNEFSSEKNHPSGTTPAK